MPSKMRLDTSLVAALAAFSGVADAFWRLPCRGRSGLARMDPLVSPGEPSYHVHTIHGSKGFGLDADMSSLLGGSCTSCEVKQDKSAYWTPALYFIDKETGDSEIVDEVGGMLAYYLLYGDEVEAFPDGFRMIAGDPFLRNFTWPVPDPPKSEWKGEQASQPALAQKALGFNCLNYDKTAEPSLGRHFLPDKDYLDANCPDGVRFEVMFPSCWNGKDVDSDDHKSHVAYPSLVMDGTCPEGFETRVVSLFFETIWNTYEFKDRNGYFALSTGDPTGFGYHGDFMHGWESGVLEKAVKECTNPSGEVSDCSIFDLQSELEQTLCTFDLPSLLSSEDSKSCKGSLPGKVAMEWGPEYAFPIKYVGEDSSSSSGSSSSSSSAASSSSSSDTGLNLSAGLADIGNKVLAADTDAKTSEPSSTSSATSTATPSSTTSAVDAKIAEPTSTSTTSTSTWTPTPTTSYVKSTITQEVVWVEQEMAVVVDENGNTISTETGEVDVLSTDYSTLTRTVSTAVNVPTAPAAKRHDHLAAHKRHSHGHAH